MSTIKVGTLLAADGSTTTQPSIPALDQRMAKAWVNFNGTGTVGIRDSYNVSSITDNAVGKYVVNLTTNLSTTSVSSLGGGARDSSFTRGYSPQVRTTAVGTVELWTWDSGSGLADWLIVCLQIFGE